MELFLEEYQDLMMTTSTGFDSVGIMKSKLPARKPSQEQPIFTSNPSIGNASPLYLSTAIPQQNYNSPLKNIAVRDRLSSISKKEEEKDQEKYTASLLSSNFEDPEEIIRFMNELLKSQQILAKKYVESMEDYNEQIDEKKKETQKTLDDAFKLVENIQKALKGRESLRKSIQQEISDIMGLLEDGTASKELIELQNMLVRDVSGKIDVQREPVFCDDFDEYGPGDMDVSQMIMTTNHNSDRFDSHRGKDLEKLVNQDDDEDDFFQ